MTPVPGCVYCNHILDGRCIHYWRDMARNLAGARAAAINECVKIIEGHQVIWENASVDCDNCYNDKQSADVARFLVGQIRAHAAQREGSG